MKSSPRIDVWIQPDGAITIDAVGYTGNTCEEATRFLEEELGVVGRKQRTRDYYRRQSNSNPNGNSHHTTNEQTQST
jgi:hypothetical protein